MAFNLYMVVVVLAVAATGIYAFLLNAYRRSTQKSIVEPVIVGCIGVVLIGAMLWAVWDESFRGERSVTCHITGKAYDEDAEANRYTTAECGELLGGGVFLRGVLCDPKVAVGRTYRLRIVGSPHYILRVQKTL